MPGEVIVKFKPGVEVESEKRTTGSPSFNAVLSKLELVDFKPALILPDNTKHSGYSGLIDTTSSKYLTTGISMLFVRS